MVLRNPEMVKGCDLQLFFDIFKNKKEKVMCYFRNYFLKKIWTHSEFGAYNTFQKILDGRGKNRRHSRLVSDFVLVLNLLDYLIKIQSEFCQALIHA